MVILRRHELPTFSWLLWGGTFVFSSHRQQYCCSLGLSSRARATVLSGLLLWQSFWWCPIKDLQNPKCSPTGWHDGHTIQMSRLLKTRWRRVLYPPVFQQIVFLCINQSNHSRTHCCLGAQSLHCFPRYQNAESSFLPLWHNAYIANICFQ